MILSVSMIISVALLCYLFNLNNKYVRIIVVYFVSICMIMLSGSLYASKVAYFPRGVEYSMYSLFYSAKLPLNTIVRIFYLSFAFYLSCGIIFIRNFTKWGKHYGWWFLPIVFFLISNDPYVSKWIYLLSYSGQGAKETFGNILTVINATNYTIAYIYMILPMLIIVRYCTNTKIYVKRRDAIVFGMCVLVINLFVQQMFMNGVYKSIMFGNVNAAKLPGRIFESTDYIFMPVVIAVIALTILMPLMYFKPFKYFSTKGVRDVRYKQRALKESRTLLHAYKNALLGVRQQIQLATENMNDKNYDDAKDNISLCGQIAEETYTNLSKILMHTGNPKIVFEKVGLQECVNDAVNKYSGSYKINVNFSEDAENILLFADKTHITEVFANLILNASDALETKKGENPHIDIDVTKDDSLVYIVIKDNGIGIEKKNLKKIFKPFYTTKTVSHGGVGLNYTEYIIKQHNGDIRVKSVHHEYTAFQITLPVYVEKAGGEKWKWKIKKYV